MGNTALQITGPAVAFDGFQLQRACHTHELAHLETELLPARIRETNQNYHVQPLTSKRESCKAASSCTTSRTVLSVFKTPSILSLSLQSVLYC